MKRWLILLPILLLLCACGKEPPPVVIAGDAGESEVAYADLGQPITAQTTLNEKEIACVPLQKDGGVYAFEMRFRQTDAIDALLRDPENVYFGVLQNGKKKLAVPMEEVRILPDVTADELALTLLVPQGETPGKGEWTVSFYVTTWESADGSALFAAEKTVTLS